MSLMNDMLRDLEKRQAPDRTQQVEAQGYGALTQKTDSHSSRAVIVLLGVIIVMLVVLAIGWWYTQTTPQVSNEPVITAAQDTKNNDASDDVTVGRVERTSTQSSEAPQSNEQSEWLPVSAKSNDELVAEAPKAPLDSVVSEKAGIAKEKKQGPVVSTQKALTDTPVPVVDTPVVDNPVVDTKEVDREGSAKKASAVATKPAKAAVSNKRLATSKPSENKKVVAETATSNVGALSKVLVVSPEQRDEQMADTAESLINAGKRQAAEAQLEAFIDEYDTDVKSRALLASLLMQDGDMSAANALLTDKKVSESSHLRRLKAHWLTQAGQPDEAVALLNSARPDISSDPEFYVLLAALYQQQGFSSEAVATYAELISYNPKVADWWVGMAIALDSSQQYPSAKKAYQKALNMEGLRFELADFAKQRLATLGG